jgi:ATP-dependent Clp protease ATP-binding subunit ClpC
VARSEERRKPYSLVLLDEIEKAHPDVFNMLLQVLEDGHLTDAKGRKVDFRNTIIIMTSNVGAESLYKEAALGFRTQTTDEQKRLEETHLQVQDKVIGDLKKTFRPEFLNRLDKVIVFRSLSRPDVRKILGVQLADLSKRLLDQGISLKVTSSAKDYLIERGYDIDQGARPMRRAIQDYIEDPLANGILTGQFKAGDTVTVLRRGDSLQLGQPTLKP